MQNRTVKTIMLLIIWTGLAGVLWLQKDQFTLTPWSPSLALEWPSYVASDGTGRSFILDRSLKRVVAVNGEGTLEFVLHGGSRERGRFFFADEITADKSGGLFLINRRMDPSGFFTVETEVQKYGADGILSQVLARKTYGEAERIPSLVQRGPWFGLGERNGTVYWFESNPSGLDLYTSEPGETACEIHRILNLENADLLVANADLAPDGSVFYVTRKGEIRQWKASGEVKTWFDSSASARPALPWRVRAADSGGLLFSDLANRSVFGMRGPGGEIKDAIPGELMGKLGLEPGDNFYLSLSRGGDGRIGTVSDFGAFLIDDKGNGTRAENPSFTPIQMALAWAWWLEAAIAIFFLAWFIRAFYVDIMGRRVPPFAKRVFSVVALTTLVGGLVAYMVLDNFSQRYSSEVTNKISQLVYLIPKLIDTDELMSIQKPDQFMDEAYLSVRRQVIQSIYGDNFERNKGLYFAIHRVNADGKLYTFMWLNGDPTIWHPYVYLWDPELAYQASLKGEHVAYSALDAFGSWLLATAPIKDAAGNVVGVFEMGGDFFSFTQENNRLIANLALNIATVLVLLLILMVEGSFLGDLNRRKALAATLGETGKDAGSEYHEVFMARPLSALLFTALSMSLLFLPLMMSSLAGGEGAKGSLVTSLGLPESVVLGLPVSLRLLFFGAGTLWAGFLTQRRGPRPVFVLGLAVSLAGVAFSALLSNPDLFLIASCVLGLGTGLATIGLRSVINGEEDPAVRGSGYSHFYAGLIAGTNLGVMAGQWLADIIGYQGVFWVSGGLILVSAWAGWFLMPTGRRPSSVVEGASVWKMVGNPRVLAFFGAIVLPVYIASMFLGYFLPIFGFGQGMSNGDMGRIFLVNGLIIIYAGPPLSEWIRKRVGPRNGVIVSSALWALSLVPFLLLRDMNGVIWTIAMMGFAEGLAVPYQNEYYLSLPSAQAIGADRASGVFEVVGKIGETVAPILIGFGLMLGPVWGFSLVAGAVALGLVIFAATTIGRKS